MRWACATSRCRQRRSASGLRRATPPPEPTPTRHQEHSMYAFDYQRPGSVADAKAAFSGDARFLAGGQSLIQAMKLRLSQSERLVDLGGLAELKAIKVDGGNVVIGA